MTAIALTALFAPEKISPEGIVIVNFAIVLKSKI
jgi:hypothetical protein